MSTSSEQAIEKLSEAVVEPGERVLRLTDSGVMVRERGCSIILALVEGFPWGRSSPVVLLRDSREAWRTEAWKGSRVRSSEHSSLLSTSGELSEASSRDLPRWSSKPPCERA